MQEQILQTGLSIRITFSQENKGEGDETHACYSSWSGFFVVPAVVGEGEGVPFIFSREELGALM